MIMQAKKPIVIALMGPTASGKTDLAIDIARAFKTNIHNIDSRQIYMDMNIGTAKPTQHQQFQIPHYLIDLCLPSKPITIHEFQLNSLSTNQKNGTTTARLSKKTRRTVQKIPNCVFCLDLPASQMLAAEV